MTNPNENRINEPFWLLLTTVVVVTAFSLVRTDFKFGADTRAKPMTFLADVQTVNQMADAPQIKPVMDKLRKQARNSFIGGVREKGQITEYSRSNPNDTSSAVTKYAADSLGGLVHFFMSLDQLQHKKRSKVRIAYFGDSMIEGDLITQDLRKMLQDTFGGYGVGFMPVTSIVAGFRISISHSFSKNWQDHEIGKSKEHPAGLCGHTFVPVYTGAAIDTTNPEAAAASWVKYTATKDRLASFYNVRMFYGSSEGTQMMTANGRHFNLDGKRTVNEVTINSGTPIKSFTASFSSSSPLDVYGFSMDSDTGIFVDNFSLRGNSGLPLSAIPSGILNGIDQYLGYDLVVLQYGVNVASTNRKDYSWYEKGMAKVVENFQRSFPGASILIIGAGDKGHKSQGRWTTDPAIPYLVESQRKLAENTGCGFWSLYDAMGGYESMATQWAGAEKPLANKDYTHFNFRGAHKVGTLLFNDIIREYKLYQASVKS